MATFKYKVTEPTFRKNMLFGPGETFVSDEPLVSRALEPADEETAEATKAKKSEVDAARRAAAAPAGGGASDLLLAQVLKDNAELKAKLEALLEAQAGGGAAPEPGKKGKRGGESQ